MNQSQGRAQVNQRQRTVYGSAVPLPTHHQQRATASTAANNLYVNSACSNLNSGLYERQQRPLLGQEAAILTPVFGDKDRRKEMPIFAGNWSRSMYDTGLLDVDTRQSTAPLEYMLDPTYAERCTPCRAPDSGWIGKQGVSYDSNTKVVDTESELFNLNRLLTRDPNYKYIPYCPHGEAMDGYPCGDGMVDGCKKCHKPLFHFPSCDLKYEYTRTSNPTCTLKETGVNRFQPVYLNPQDRCRWEHPGETGINYRMVVKDNHVPCISYPLDPTPALPRGGDIPCEMIQPTCGVNTAAMSPFTQQ